MTNKLESENTVNFTQDERAIIMFALLEMYERYSKPYCRQEFQKAADVPKPSKEMVRMLRTVDSLRVKLKTSGWYW